jgi:Spy/CpxP family protein refolding chaperone
MSFRFVARPFALALPLALALSAASLGCSGTAGSEPAVASPDTATSRAPVAQSTHGVVKVLGDAFGDVAITTSQRAAVESLATAAETRHLAARAAHRDLTLAIAAQVQAGAIDRAALQPRIDAVVAAMQQIQPADRAAFEQLHAILDPDQRTALVDAIEARVAEHAGKHTGHHALKQWATDLGLSDAQRAQIKDALEAKWQARGDGPGPGHGAHEAMGEAHEHGGKVMAAFKQDRFVMDEVAPPQDVAQRARGMSDHLLGIAEIALPILTPEQRAIAAQKLRARAESQDEDGPGLP